MEVTEAIQAGQAAEDRGDFVGAAAAYSSLLEHSDPRVLAEAKTLLGRVYFRQGLFDKSLAINEEVRAYAIRTGDRNLRARVENSIGASHVRRGEFTQAKAAYAVAMELTEDNVTRAKISLNLGVIANVEGTLDIARRYYAASLALSREADDERGQALALHNAGMLHSDLGEWDEADEVFREALGLFEREGNRQMIAQVLENRSEVLFGRGLTQEAVAECDLALAIYAEIGDERGRGEVLRWKGHGLRLMGRHGAALVALNESVRIAQRSRSRLLEGEATRELGHVYKADNRPKDARTAFTRALAIFTELGAQRDGEATQAELAKLS